MRGCTQRWAHHAGHYNVKRVLNTSGAVRGFGLEQLLEAGPQVEIYECFPIQLQLFIFHVFCGVCVIQSKVLSKALT